MLSSRLMVFASVSALAACSQGQDQSPDQSEMSLENDGVSVLGSAILALADNSDGGSASIVTDADGKVSIEIDVLGVEPGAHSLYLHETGACDAPDFNSAGDHLDPIGKDHGLETADGNLPNLMIDENGTGSSIMSIDGEETQLIGWLFDEDGTAIVVHAGRDDPSSANIRDRVACGVLTQL